MGIADLLKSARVERALVGFGFVPGAIMLIDVAFGVTLVG